MLRNAENGIYLTFRNRIGLSAGFDKGAEIFDELADYGFGFIEVGTVTPDSQDGNPRPRIFRLPQCESLISRTGFNNPGLDVIKRRLEQKSGSYVLGVNINKNPSSEGEQAVADFLRLYKELHPHVGYFTLNWGSVDVALMKQVLQGLAAFSCGAKHTCSVATQTSCRYHRRRNGNDTEQD